MQAKKIIDIYRSNENYKLTLQTKANVKKFYNKVKREK